VALAALAVGLLPKKLDRHIYAPASHCGQLICFESTFYRQDDLPIA